jgi:hypothetical protein|tara:strand:- start:929 stop:1543 length:615 start_codon:yes stop_codon:yes gene_type:complete
MKFSFKIWLPILFIYLAFTLWYTNLSGPLSDQEIAAYKEIYEESNRDPDQWERAFKFMSEDDGKDFYMVNFLDSNESPRTMEATGEGATSFDLQMHYMEYMWPQQFKRASHPVFFAYVLNPALDIVAAQGMEDWDMVAIFRYRSRRDLFEIALNPIFDERHEYKVEALDKTIAIPVETPFITDLRFALFVFLLLFGLIIERIRA